MILYDTTIIGPATFAPDELFDQALKHHRQNNLAAAGKIYRAILQENPGHVGAMQNLIDVLCTHEGRHLEAVPLALNVNDHREVSQKIAEHCHRFFENAKTVHAWECFFEQAVKRGR